MSGHSKWSSIKHKKAAADTKRGKLFTKLVKEISVAAREGGGDVEMNARLRTAVQTAKDNNMPQDNIERAIKKGTGELPGVTYIEISYEGYGPNGIAIMIDVLTDNKNRAAAEIRKIFSKRGGSLGENGCVAWMFKKKGFVSINSDKIEEDDLMEILLEAGAEDLVNEGDIFEVYCEVPDFENVKKAIKEKNIEWELSELTMIPNSTIKIDDKHVAKQILGLIDEIEDNDDVQKVYSNFDIDDSLMQAL